MTICHKERSSDRAAASGSGASRIARTTAIRVAPAATTSPTVVSSMPPIANQGRVARAAASRTSSRPPVGVSVFVGVSKTGPTPR